MTPEERASEKAVEAIKDSLFHPLTAVQVAQRRLGYMKAWIEQVEPLEAENANLRALVQVLVDGMAGHARSCVGTCSCGFYGRIASALIAAKEHGFVPTNTEDNG